MKAVKADHPVMKDVLEETNGVMVYQEQVMRILERLGGIVLSSAYTCIKAVSKKKLDQYIATNGLYTGAFGYVKGYFAWLWGFVTFNWPRSIKGSREVWPHLKDALANSLRLGLIATVTGILVGNLLGIAAALRSSSGSAAMPTKASQRTTAQAAPTTGSPPCPDRRRIALASIPFRLSVR